MERVHYILGLPRTCSTVLARVLSQNPRIFATNTCGTPSFIKACDEVVTGGREFAAMNMEQLNNCYKNFLYNGMKGWYETLTDKPIILSKSKLWINHLTHAFSFDEKSKYIVTVRDLRDIICSYETMTWKYPYLSSTHNIEPFQARVQTITDPNKDVKLGPWLIRLPSLMEMVSKEPNKFMFIRQEDFTKHPVPILKDIYTFLEEDYFTHNLNDIPDAPYLENDTVYMQPISHKVRKKLENIKPRWPLKLTKEESDYILETFDWYYNLFYPEELEQKTVVALNEVRRIKN